MFEKLRSFFGMAKSVPQPTPPAKELEELLASAPSNQQAMVSEQFPKIENPQAAHVPTGQKRVPIAHVAEVDLVLGIDFGTSCTKVVIGDHGWLGHSYAVPIGEGENGLDFYLRANQVKVDRCIEANLKMRLMKNPDSKELKELVALYLAGIIRDSLGWFSSKGPHRYAGRTPVWRLTLGFPAKQVEDGPLIQAYREAADLASRLGTSDLPLNLSSFSSLYSNKGADSCKRVIQSDHIEIFPEIAAQLAGYINSPHRASGNLIIIDVGAGTLDVSTAILHGNQEEDVLSFHVCEVGHLGALELLICRMAALNEVEKDSVKTKAADFLSGATPTPEDPAAILGGNGYATSAQLEAFKRVSKEFADEVIRLAIRCASQFRKLQRNTHANASFDPWPGQLRLFFTGGGSRLKFYKTLFIGGHFEQELSRFTRWSDSQEERCRKMQGLKLEPLPPPSDFRGLPESLASDFDRFSVAHGLAFGRENLMRITASGPH